MTNSSQRRRFPAQPDRDAIQRAVAAAFDSELPAVQLAAAAGAAARVLVGATDTGRWHGPVEEFTFNGYHGYGSFRVERRARDLREVGTLRALADEADKTGAGSVSEHLRKLAAIFVETGQINAYCNLSAAGAITSDSDSGQLHGPAIRVAYHAPTDMFVDVLVEAHGSDPAVFRSPMGYVDRCAANFLHNA